MNQNYSELNDVITENQNLIHSLSKQFDYNVREDLFQVGAMGMIDAYHNFNSDKNTKFSTYAYPYVLGEMKKFVREDRSIRISREIIYLCSRIERVKDLLAQRYMREPTISEVAYFLQIDENKIIEALEVNKYVKSIDETINDDGKELTLKDVIGEYKTYDIIDLISLRDELSNLSSQEKALVEKRFIDGMTQCETAAILGVSQVEVSRMEKKLKSNLKNKLAA